MLLLLLLLLYATCLLRSHVRSNFVAGFGAVWRLLRYCGGCKYLVQRLLRNPIYMKTLRTGSVTLAGPRPATRTATRTATGPGASAWACACRIMLQSGPQRAAAASVIDIAQTLVTDWHALKDSAHTRTLAHTRAARYNHKLKRSRVEFADQPTTHGWLDATVYYRPTIP